MLRPAVNCVRVVKNYSYILWKESTNVLLEPKKELVRNVKYIVINLQCANLFGKLCDIQAHECLQDIPYSR
jgi:hypothetical protein